MELYAFVRGLLAWMASVACLFPVTVPILFFSYRILAGRVSEDDENRMDDGELWTRSTLAAAALGGLTFALVFADFVFADWLDLPSGLVHFMAFLALVPAATFTLMILFAYEDFFAALGHLTIFFGLPMLVLVPINALLGLWNPVVGFFGRFLKEVA